MSAPSPQPHGDHRQRSRRVSLSWARSYGGVLLLAALTVVALGTYSYLRQRYDLAACASFVGSEIVVAGDEHYPPFEYVDDGGRYRGYNVDVVQALASEYGLSIRFVPLAWKKAVEALAQGEVDAVQGMFDTPQRRAAFGFRFTSAHLRMPQVIFVREGGPRIAKPRDLAGRRVAVQEGDLAHDLLSRAADITLVTYSSQLQALQALQDGDVDAYAGNRYTGLYNLQHGRLGGIEVVGDALAVTPYAIAVRADDRALWECLDGGVRLLRRRGTLERLEVKWFGRTAGMPRNMLRALALLAFILLTVVGWGVSLRGQVRARTAEISEANRRLEAELAERIHAEQRVQDLLAEQTALGRLAISASSAHTVQGVFAVLARDVADMTPTQGMALTVCEPEGEQATDVALAGEWQEAIISVSRLDERQREALWCAVHTGRSERLRDLAAATPSMADESAQPVTAKPLSALFIPIPWGDGASAVLRCYTHEAYTFRQSELLEHMAGVAAVAFGNARLFQEATSRARRLAAVNRVASAVGAMLALDDLVETVHRELVPEFQPDACFIGLYNADLHAMDYRLLVDQGVREPPQQEPVRSGLVSLVISDKRTLLIRRMSEEQVGLPTPSLWGTMRVPESWLGVPMLIGERVIGVISVQAYRRDAYDEEDAELLKTIADQVAVAVESARLYQAVRDELQERRLLEDQLRQAKKMEAIGQLAGGIAHDFNNLLTVINGYSQLVLDMLEPDHYARADVAEVLKAGERAAALTRQLLAFSRRQVMEMRVLDLNQIVEGMTHILGRALRETIVLDISLQEGLWPVRADASQLEQVLLNLGVNASDAMPDGGRLTVATENVVWPGAVGGALGDMPAGDYVRLCVADTGAGMSDEVLEHLYEPFFTTKGPDRGTGLGLATVYGIVKQSSGYIACHSQVGQGTTFEIYLPRAVSGHTERSAVLDVEEAPLDGRVVLLVEDEAVVRAIVADALLRHGLRVLQASGGQEALELVDGYAEEIDLVLTDVIMPGLSGPQLVAALRQKRPGLRVLYMSGYAHEALGDTLTTKDGVAILQKPFTPAALLARVRATLSAPGK